MYVYRNSRTDSDSSSLSYNILRDITFIMFFNLPIYQEINLKDQKIFLVETGEVKEHKSYMPVLSGRLLFIFKFWKFLKNIKSGISDFFVDFFMMLLQ